MNTIFGMVAVLFSLDSRLKKFLLREVLKITSDYIRVYIQFVSPTASGIMPVFSKGVN